MSMRVSRGRGRATTRGERTSVGIDGALIGVRPRGISVRAAVALLASIAVTAAVLVSSPARVYAVETFHVDSTSDAVDAVIGDGLCATATDECTLRAAIQEANAAPGADVVQIPAGTYRLAIAPAADGPEAGDLDILAPVTLAGAGAAQTIIQGGPLPDDAPPEQTGMDRLVEIHPTAGNTTVRALTLTEGWSADSGGALATFTPGTVRLTEVIVSDSLSEAEGGGIHQETGTLIITDSTVSGNTARGGGGVHAAGVTGSSPASLTVQRSTIAGNEAHSAGGGVAAGHEGNVRIVDSVIAENLAESHGGGIDVGGKGSFTLEGGEVRGNATPGDGAGLSTSLEGRAEIIGTLFRENRAGIPVEGEIPEGGGGGADLGGSGPVEVTDATFEANSASGEGGGILLTNNASIDITDTVVTGNTAGAGAGIENAAMDVTLTRLTITGNEAELDGGGIESQGSGSFVIIDTMIADNTAENGGGFANAADGALHIQGTTIWNNRALQRFEDDSGLGGGIYSLGDAAALYENVTVAGNVAAIRGGGVYIDADAPVHITSATIAHNSAPIASGIGGEIGSPNLPIQPSTGVILRNTIVAANVLGPSCSFAMGSEGGNIDDGDSCYFRGEHDRANARAVGLDAVADNGGHTMTMALQPESHAIDAGVSPCPETDQRGVDRPQNIGCDSGAFEHEGPFAPADAAPPDTAYLSGPTQDTEATSVFRFTGIDDTTDAEDLRFECRLIEHDPTEPPEPVDPTAPIDPALAFVGCPNPWQVPIVEEGHFTFEVRAIDRAGNIDPTPATHSFESLLDLTPPETTLLTHPEETTGAAHAVFTFSATDDATPQQFLEFECRLDSFDPEAWLECTNPAVYSNLTLGTHTFQVRAADGSDNIDPSPASWTWTVGAAQTCEDANITLLAAEDATVDEALPLENASFSEFLLVRSQAPGQNARALIRFDLPDDGPDCALESARLRLHGEADPGRTLEAAPIAALWWESLVTWQSQPAAAAGGATTESGSGYHEWDVTAHVAAALAGDIDDRGWLIRDAAEEDPAGSEASFLSSEAVSDPPTPPQLVLRFAASNTPAPPAPSEPTVVTEVACGQVLTVSTLVGNDLSCPGEGLVIGADDIVLDLNGHTIRSSLVIEPGEEDSLGAGIRNAGHTNVVIRGGRVENFGYGVRLMAGAAFNVVHDMTLRGNINAGVELFDADNGRVGSVVRDNVFSLNGDGVTLVFGAEGNVIEHNEFSGNAGRAVYAFDAAFNVLRDNSVSGLTHDPLLDSDGGFYLEGSTDTVISGNFIADTGDAAIVVTAGSHRTVVEQNTTTRASDAALSADGSRDLTVAGNVFHLAGGAGIAVSDIDGGEISGNDVRFNPGGIEITGSRNLLVEDNDARQTGADGIVLEATSLTIVRANRVEHTGAGGISVEGEVLDAAGDPIDGNVIEDNQASGNLGDGISVNGAGHTVRGNEAYNNGGWGISADLGTDDGGGNLASGNAEPAQCVGVACAPGTAPAPVAPDLVAPDTAVTVHPVNGSSSLSPQRFEFSGSDDQAPLTALRFQCRLDAPPDPEPEPPDPPDPGDPPEPVEPPAADNWSECGSPTIYSYLLAGEHSFEVRAVDPSDNVDLTPAVHTWIVVPAPVDADELAPSTTIDEGPDNPSDETTATFSFRGSDNATPGPYLTYECRLDGAAWAACTSPITYPDLTLEDHVFEVRTTDLAGNADASPPAYAWSIVAPPEDHVAPQTEIVSGPDAVTVATTSTFVFTSDDPTATFVCALDDDEGSACASPWSIEVGEGVHSLEIHAIDPAGNEDDTPATWTWEVGPPPAPSVLSCGAVVTQSVRLTADLADCLADGIVAGAHGITIDLDGHTVDGTGLGSGILISGFRDVTVTGGTVQEFDFGVHFAVGAVRAIADDVTLQLNADAGVLLADADDGTTGATVRHSSVTGNGVGVHVSPGTQAALIHDNVISSNSGQGILLDGASGSTLRDNVVSGSADAGVHLIASSGNSILDNELSGAADASMVLELASDANIVQHNDIQAGEAGILVAESSGNQLLDNRANGMGDNGIELELATGTLVRGNDLRYNTGGLALGGSSGNRIEANNTSNNDGAGIEIGADSASNILVGNTANSNEGDGIAIGTHASAGLGTVIEANTASGNAGDGIYVGDVSHMIRSNVANDNGGWGVYSALGSVAGANVDGGGNRASGNVGGGIDPFTQQVIQCHNIRCDGDTAPSGDLVAPETSIVSGPGATTALTRATLRFSGSDNATGVTFECSLDAADFAACESPMTATDLAVGAHSFLVRAVDWIGNVDATPAAHMWTIVPPDPHQAPDTTIVSGPDAVTAQTSASLAFDSDEEGTTYECSLDGAAFAPCASPATFTGLPAGAHTFAVRGTDPEANVEADPAVWSWTISAAPSPTAATCGMTVTTSILLTADLLDCLGDGLVVGASGITIDLGGRTVSGTGLGAGVRNPGFDAVAVTNGILTDFDFGILLQAGTGGNVVSSVSASVNQDAGVGVLGGDPGNVVRTSQLSENAVGLVLAEGTTGATIADNVLTGSAGDGVRLWGVSGNAVTGNTIAESSQGGIGLEQAVGNTIEDNAISTSGGGGIVVELASHGNHLWSNTISAGATGISISESDDTQLAANIVSGVGGGGLVIEASARTIARGNDVRYNAAGIDVFEGVDTLLEQNNAGAQNGTGISVDATSLRTVVRGNASSGNSGDGLEVSGVATDGGGVVVDGNVTNFNSGDGVSVPDAGHVIRGNSASLNDGWGVYAGSGGMDGGGNSASGNAEPAQCFNVVCAITEAPGAPDTTIVLHPQAASPSANALFTFTGFDDATAASALGFECRLDSISETAWVECENPWEYFGLTAGSHTFEVRAVDELGAVDATPATYTWVYEPLPTGVAPETFIGIKPAAETPLFEAIFTFSSDEPDVTYECRIDGAAWVPCAFAVEYEFAETAYGTHTFEVRATDPRATPTPHRPGGPGRSPGRSRS